jgi:leader peptidase (prepilin peptidase)/N-methyltransferase
MIFFLFGLFWGSFLNTVALRLERGENYITQKSHCPHCQTILRWYELIPLFSFLLQLGRCRTCKHSLSWRYPLVELMTGTWVYLLSRATPFVFTNLSISLPFLYYFIFLSLMFILALYDFQTTYIDEGLVWFGAFIWVLFQLAFTRWSFVDADFSGFFNYFFTSGVSFRLFDRLFFAFSSALFFIFVFLITFGRGMGLGDAKVAFLMGLYLKPGDVFLSIFLAFFFGSIIGLVRLIKNRQWFRQLPFVPFLFLGIMVTIVFGHKLVAAYFNGILP